MSVQVVTATAFYIYGLKQATYLWCLRIDSYFIGDPFVQDNKRSWFYLQPARTCLVAHNG